MTPPRQRCHNPIGSHGDQDRENTSSRLGPTDYEWPSRERSPIIARSRFFEAVRTHAPQVLEDLRAEPIDLVVRIATTEEISIPPVWQDLIEAVESSDPDLVALHDVVLGWSHRWHLDTDWCRDQALRTLIMWTTVPVDDPARTTWSLERGSLFQPVLRGWPPFRFYHAPWDPTFTSRTTAVKALHDAFDQKLAQYLNSVEDAAMAMGMQSTPEKRTDDHFAWLARYQIGGESFDRLAKDVFRDRRTVAAGIKAAARLIGLPLRSPGRPGRPRRSQHQ